MQQWEVGESQRRIPLVGPWGTVSSGDYDALRVRKSLVELLVGWPGLLVLPIGRCLWLYLDDRGISTQEARQRRRGGRAAHRCKGTDSPVHPIGLSSLAATVEDPSSLYLMDEWDAKAMREKRDGVMTNDEAYKRRAVEPTRGTGYAVLERFG